MTTLHQQTVIEMDSSRPADQSDVTTPNCGSKEEQTLLARLDRIEGITTARGLRNLSGDVTCYLHLLRQLDKAYLHDMKQLKEHLDCGDLQQAYSVAHTLTGAAGTLGLVQMQTSANALATRLRKDVNENGSEMSNVLADVLLADFNQLHTVLAHKPI